MVFICLVNEPVDDVSVGDQEREFKSPNVRFISAFVKDLYFDFSHEDICKSYYHFGAHRVSVRLQVILFVFFDEVDEVC